MWKRRHAPAVPGASGIIGTKGTIGSGAYQSRLEARGLRVWAQACPMLVHAVEEGLSDSPEAELLVRHYLNGPAGDRHADPRCTHYPLLRGAIARAVGPAVALVDSAEVTAERVSAAFSRRRGVSGRAACSIM